VSAGPPRIVQSVRVAFLILNHRPPAQLMRLVTTLRLELPEAPIVVHNDESRTHLPVSALDPLGHAYLLTSDDSLPWGGFGMVDAIYRSMAWMVEHIEFDWLILLSGQDYPIKPLATLGDYLAAIRADVMMEATPIDQLTNRKARRNRHYRYLYQYRLPAPGLQPAGRLSQLWPWLRRHIERPVDVLNNLQPYFHVFKLAGHGPWRVGRRARRTPFTPDQPCWCATTWISFSHRAAAFVISSFRERPDYVEYYRRTMHPGESAIATLVCNAPGLRREPHDIHHVRWTQVRTAHPDTFVAADLPELLTAPEHEYFARKFDTAEDAGILDELDRMLAAAREASQRANSGGLPGMAADDRRG
jgi:Core-2/I-Branching enzyme